MNDGKRFVPCDKAKADKYFYYQQIFKKLIILIYLHKDKVKLYKV